MPDRHDGLHLSRKQSRLPPRERLRRCFGALPKRLAIALAVGSVAAGLVGVWLFAGLEGGSLGLIDYLVQVQGVLVPIELATAGLVALATLR